MESVGMERVVVTGMGVVSCIGNNKETFWESLKGGVSGIDTIQAFDPAPFSSQMAGEVKDFSLPPKQGKRMERFTQFAVAASNEALVQAGLIDGEGKLEGVEPDRVGVSIGSGIGGFPYLMKEHEKFLEKGPGKFHPLTIPIIISNMASANVGITWGLLGPNICVSTACSTGNQSIATAADQIKLGRADAMLAGGSESTMTPFALDGYAQLRALSNRNDDPKGASRPFSRERDGFVLAEGCGVLLLESLSHAKKRGAEILAEVCGYGQTADAYHLTAPDPEGKGAARAMALALEDARLNPEDVGYINAHGTSTPLNDALETAAIKKVFGTHAKNIPISSIKSMTGHALGGASGIEAVASVLVLQHKVLPPTINLTDPDPDLDLDYVPLTARETKAQVVISNSFAFGGHNAAMIFKGLK